jgi:lipopolysaccharide export LptBFGC system permease protein LptF
MSIQPSRGLDTTEKILFAIGVFAFAFLMLLFGEPFGDQGDVPVVIAWIVVGLGFIWWFDRHLAKSRSR